MKTINDKLPLEDIESLSRLMDSDDWPILTKYVRLLAFEVQRKLIELPSDSQPHDILAAKAKADGASEVIRAFEDLKPFFRNKHEIEIIKEPKKKKRKASLGQWPRGN